MVTAVEVFRYDSAPIRTPRELGQAQAPAAAPAVEAAEAAQARQATQAAETEGSPVTDLATITPTAIDALVHIESIRVVGRHRYVLGDLDELAKSIADVGLLNPITLTRDSRLVAGQRRLEACRRLGLAEVPVRFVDSLNDAAKLLRAERDENTCRKEMLPSELASLGEALYEVAAQEAKDRQRAGQERGRATRHGLDSSLQGGIQERDRSKETAAVVGEALGMGRSTYHDLRHVYRAATDPEVPEGERTLARAALDKIDRGGGIQSTAAEFRRQQRAKRDAQEAKAAALADPPAACAAKPPETRDDPNWIPAKGDSSPRASAQRRNLIRQMAGQGHSSEQIGARLGILDGTVRRIARADGISIPADEALGARTRKKIDSNRIVRETVAMLEGLDMGLQLVNYDDLDPAEIESWVTSLGDSIRVLTGMKKQLTQRMKEMTL